MYASMAASSRAHVPRANGNGKRCCTAYLSNYWPDIPHRYKGLKATTREFLRNDTEEFAIGEDGVAICEGRTAALRK